MNRRDEPSPANPSRESLDDLPERLSVQIECEPAHLGNAVAVLKAELAGFRHYDRVGWGWRCRNGAVGPWFFVRRVRRGLSVRQDRLKALIASEGPLDGASPQILPKDNTHAR